MSSYAEIKSQAEQKLRERNAEEARALYLQAAQMQGMDLDALGQSAQHALAQNDVDGAATTFLKVIEANPTDVRALLGLARISIFLGKNEDAEQYLKGVSRLDPQNGLAHTLRGLIHESRGNMEEALAEFAQGAEQSPNEYLPVYNYGRALAVVDRHPEAIPQLNNAIELDPQNYDAFYALGTSLAEYKRFGDAVWAFNQAMKLRPKNVDIYVTLADVLTLNRDPEAAISVLNAGMNECGEHPAMLEKASMICMGMGKWANAKEYTEKVVEALPNYVQGWLNLANFCILTQELEKSEEAAKKVLELNPNIWQAHYHLGNLYEAVNLLEQAETSLRTAADLAPNDVEPWANLGLVLLRSDDPKDIDQAIEVLEKATQLAPPGEFRPHYNLALAYIKADRKPKARDFIKEVGKQIPGDNDFYDEFKTLMDTLFSGEDELKMNLAIASMMRDAKKLSPPKPDDKDSNKN